MPQNLNIWFFLWTFVHKTLWLFSKEFIKSTIFVFDNASIHLSDRCKSYFKWKKLSVLTLPPHTPEQNNVEQDFKRLNTDFSKQDLSKKRLDILLQRL